ncbi:hypothetical protein Sviol_03410 [Streptomyces violascens]|uniref:Uncharacterized protein n=1 Tax=Streptomyces violascens TaxID=67381 RepID=A0ABQ3QF78_9ACTN|nr:hypothetical protein Sviol_03410 [Streptomyces violascens]
MRGAVDFRRLRSILPPLVTGKRSMGMRAGTACGGSHWAQYVRRAASGGGLPGVTAVT